MTHFRLALGAHLWQDPSTSSLWGPPPASRGFVQHLAYHLRVGLSDQHKTASVMVREDTLTPYAFLLRDVLRSCPFPGGRICNPLFSSYSPLAHLSKHVQIPTDSFRDTTPDSNLFPLMTSYCLQAFTTHSHTKVFFDNSPSV